MKTFTIITPNFNSADKLGNTFASVAGQNADFEYVIVDGASTDHSIEIARNLASIEKGMVRLISEPDQGIYDAMNKGIRASIGRYILFLGAGDILHPEVLQQVSNLLPKDNRSFIYGDSNWAGARYDGAFDWRKLLMRNICQQAIFYGRDTFQICGDFNLKYSRHADWEFNLRCFGRRAITKRYVPLLISDFELGGASAVGDECLQKDWKKLQPRHLGHWRMAELGARRVSGRLRHVLTALRTRR